MTMSALGELKLKAMDSAELGKAIAKIKKTVPAPNFPLVPVHNRGPMDALRPSNQPAAPMPDLSHLTTEAVASR